MSRNPAYLGHKEIPDEELLNKIKAMMKDGKGPNKMKPELPNSLYIIRRYYTKILKKLW